MSRVVDVKDCPLHNVVHDVALFPIYYDPIYHPHCFPEIFESPSSVKQWIDSALNSHVSVCQACLSKGLKSGIRFSVQWQGSHFVVCAFLNGKLKQCILSLKDLEKSNYTHCWLLSRLSGKCFPLRPHVVQSPETGLIFNVSIVNEDPKWLYYPDATYRLHLSQLSVSVLAVAVTMGLMWIWKISMCLRALGLLSEILHVKIINVLQQILSRL